MQKPEGYSGLSDAPRGEVLSGPRWYFWSQNRYSGEGANPHVSGPNQFGKPTSMLDSTRGGEIDEIDISQATLREKFLFKLEQRGE